MTEHELPEGFRIQDASNGDRVISTDGEVEYVVIIDEYSGEHRTIRADAVEWDGWYEHPVLQGTLAALISVLALLAPMALGAYTIDGFVVAAQENGETGEQLWRNVYALGAIFGAAGVATGLIVLRRTRLTWWLYRYNRYADVRHDLKRAGEE